MSRPEAGALLQVWERCAAQSTTMRGLAMLSVALPHARAGELAELPIGARDGALLDLRAELFGSRLDCVTACLHCGAPIELAVPVAQIRAESTPAEARFSVAGHGRTIGFRLPHSADLLAIEACADAGAGERALIGRCITDCDVATLSDEEIDAVDRRMGELDPQAEIVFDVICPACGHAARAVFDIVSHLWTELEAWARSLMREIHTLAVSYGWSEAQILALGTARRRAYLDFIDGA